MNKNRIRGMLLKKRPYKIRGVRTSMIVALSDLTNLEPGDKVYQERLDNGMILLIPEQIYTQENEDVYWK
jgi:hypothetical protein